MADNNRLEELFNKWLLRQANPQELQELGSLLKKTGSEDQLSQASQAIWNKVKSQNLQYPVDWDVIYNTIVTPTQTRVVNLKRRSWFKVAAAAAILVVLLGGYFLFKSNNVNRKAEIVSQKDVEAPKMTKATITLVDGRVVSIDSLTTINQYNVQVRRTSDGRIVYTGSSTEMVYNTLTNPRGSKVIDLTLADGSKVWLNAGSSITYPVAFVANERKVSVTGEAYLEITHDASRPFTLSKGEMNVQVLGTKFNVNAYEDESEIRVTLLEGKIQVSRQFTVSSHQSALLKAGQQAIIPHDSPISGIRVISAISVDEVMAWKNGLFDFNNADLQGIMRQLARWYNVEVIYKGTAPEKSVTGQISRSVSVSNVLKMIELTGRVKFTIDGNKIFVEGK